MKQVLQSLKDGSSKVVDVPLPQLKPGHILIRTTRTLVSVGTEKMLLKFGKANLLGKALQQPEKLKQAANKARTDGLLSTVGAIRGQLNSPLPMGYCNVGIVEEIGEGVVGFDIGDRVASNGPHAEVVCVPANLCVKVPADVPDEQAVFTVAAAIALQGIRLLGPTFGETFVVTGLGLIGLISVQLLKAQGCRVLGVDFDEKKLDLAVKYGAETVNLSKGQDPIATSLVFSKERGVDGVLITAATESDNLVDQAAKMCRKRGRIILVGTAGLNISRAEFYEKELSFQVSCSYGPGRYDSVYEEHGVDYPIGFVRWTVKRNFEAILEMSAEGNLDFSDLVTHNMDIADAEKAYQLISKNEPCLGILFGYGDVKQKSASRTINLERENSSKDFSRARLSFIGVGNYVKGVLLPEFKKAGVVFADIAGMSSHSAIDIGKKYKFCNVTTDIDSVFQNDNCNSIVVATRHDTHAHFVIKGLQSKKHVFVEKPLCISLGELEKVEHAWKRIALTKENLPIFMVGFNRRFAPHTVKMKSLLKETNNPLSFIYTVNAGFLPYDHWVQNRKIGGGRIIGEVCHFVDLLRFLVGQNLSDYESRLPSKNSPDSAVIDLTFEDGSSGTIHYLTNGNKGFSKERLEIFVDGKILQLDNFKKLRGYGWKSFKKMNLWHQDKGQGKCVRAFVRAVEMGCEPPIPLEELFEVTRATIQLSK